MIGNILIMIIGLVAGVTWIINLVQWDGKCHCDKSECDKCPFPCDRQKEDDDDGIS